MAVPNLLSAAPAAPAYRLQWPGGLSLEVRAGFLPGTGRVAATAAGAMIPLSPATRIFLASGATDLRKSFEGLSDLVSHQFKEDPLSGHLYVFANRRKNRIKLLYFDGTGVWVCAKRLMGRGCFAWPKTDEPGALAHRGRGVDAAFDRH